MRDRRRMLLSQLGGASFAIPTFDGSHAIFGDEKQGYIECYSSGTITFPKAGKVDVCIVGGGGKGGTGSGVGNGSPTVWTYSSGKGGDGGKIATYFNIAVIPHGYNIQIGSAASNSVFDGYSSSGGSVLASGGVAVTVSGETAPSPSYWVGNKGNDAPHIFSDSRFPQYGGGGGSGALTWGVVRAVSGGAGGILGGGSGASATSKTPYYTDGTAGSANTGGGGGGTAYSGGNGSRGTAQQGGSGIVIIRWGYAA